MKSGLRRVAVVGGGIVGVSTAEWLRRDGAEVTLIDRIDPGDPAQTSYGNAGLLARAAIVPVPTPGMWRSVPKMLLDPDGPVFLRWRYLPRLLPWLVPFLRSGSESQMRRIAAALADIVTDSVDQHIALARGTGAERFIETGDYTYLYPNRASYEKDALGFALRREHGFAWQELDRAALLERDSHLGPEIGFGVSFPDHGWIRDPGGYVAALAAHFVAAGGQVRRGEVKSLRRGDNGPELTLEGETLGFDQIVLCAGAWSKGLGESLGHRVPLESERGYHMVFRAPSHKPPNPYMIADGKFVMTPMEAGIRCAGLVEFGGLDAPPSKAPPELFLRRIRRIYPGLSWESEERWMGHRPSTIDSLPMIGESAKAPGVYFAFGAQHIGLTTGPKTGRIVADLIAGRRPNFDLSPFAVDRFDG